MPEKDSNMNKLRDIAIITAAALALWVTLLITGCTTDKVTLPNGTEIIHQKLFYWGSASRVEFILKDIATTVTIILENPSSKVNPGKLIIKEPKTGIEAGLESN
jgi:hypothetical protein